MAKDLEHIKVILTEALEKETETERKAYLDEVCRTDVNLRAEVESLLRSHDNAGEFLEESPFGPNITLDESPLSEGPGTVIGRYKLLEKIGEGGMAVVYMAEQTEPIRRKIALKIIKLGMDTKSVIARFEAERQALAMMDHPNIARVLDAGATETGRPYFVMELVTGVSITEYCDKNNLSTKERLALFIQVCNAVQHAHQKSIIHRDIKPTNLMVTLHDGVPVPKVIDFGIAKAINQKLTEKTLFTRYAHIIGTPAYMSPEQADLSDFDVDTRSDIYSLGVLLYELLTGTTPFSEEELRKAGYLEMQRIIREQEPTKPSTKLSTLGDTLTDIAKYRACTPDLLTKAIRGDLDWIVMKTLEKVRDRRYDNASALALDVQRHLDNQPILARAPSTVYRLNRLLQRHRTQTKVALIIAIFVVALIAVLSIWNHNRRQWNRKDSLRYRRELSQAEHSLYTEDLALAFAEVKPLLNSRYVKQEATVLFDRIQARARDKVSYYAGKIESEPNDAKNYFHRAKYYDILGMHDKAYSDRAQYATLLEGSASTGFEFGIAERLGSAVNSTENEWMPRLSQDGLSLFFQRNYESGVEAWVATRVTTQDPWNPATSRPEGAGIPERTEYFGIVPGEMTIDGLEFYFWSGPGGYGESDIYMIRRTTKDSTWTKPINLGATVNSKYCEIMPSILPNGLELYFSDYTHELARPGGHGGGDLWVTRRTTRNDPWQEPENLGPEVNSPSNDSRLHISSDGLLLLFDSKRSGGFGGADIYMTRRKSLSDSWEKAVNLGPSVNTPASEYNPCISSDGYMLYFVRDHDIWQAPIISDEINYNFVESTYSIGQSEQNNHGKEVIPK